SVFETDLFTPIMKAISEVSTKGNDRAKRIVADHMRTSVFMISDGVIPSNTDRGYILRRLLRRAVRYADMLGMEEGTLPPLVDIVVDKYKEVYPQLFKNKEKTKEEVSKEVLKFRKTLEHGLRQINKLFDKYDGNAKEFNLSIEVLFDLYQTHGFPIEISLEEISRRRIELGGIALDDDIKKHFINLFNEEMKKHQDLSRSGIGQKFKGGLADTNEMSVKYHTATHLLNQALREVLGDHVAQKGSNITKERLRFDFSHGEKMTDEEKKKVEDLVNEKIMSALPVSYEDVSIEEARVMGAIGVFNDKYEDQVRVYQIGLPATPVAQASDESTGIFSLEICGGPHVKNTSELGHFRIKKEEASSAGVRRIKAVLE
ncbi:Alanyl-tRNA synthetase, partial [hydrothermal vent metagenome]